MASYDSQNLFAKILRGELPCFNIYEDERTLAFLDIMPRCHGHALVIPKGPARTLLDCPADDLAALILATQRVAQAAKRAFQADGITIQQFNEAAGGQEIFHLHIHVLPRRAGEALCPPGIKADPAVLEQHAAQLKAEIGSLKPEVGKSEI